MDNRSLMMKMEYKAQQKKEHILTANQAASLFEFLDIRLQDKGCDHTHRFTQEWLDANISEFKRISRTRCRKDSFIEEIDFDFLEIHVIEELY